MGEPGGCQPPGVGQRLLLVSRTGCRPPVTVNDARLSSSLEVSPAKTLILPFSTTNWSRLL